MSQKLHELAILKATKRELSIRFAFRPETTSSAISGRLKTRFNVGLSILSNVQAAISLWAIDFENDDSFAMRHSS